jgi:hypothetical protein
MKTLLKTLVLVVLFGTATSIQAWWGPGWGDGWGDGWGGFSFGFGFGGHGWGRGRGWGYPYYGYPYYGGFYPHYAYTYYYPHWGAPLLYRPAAPAVPTESASK